MSNFSSFLVSFGLSIMLSDLFFGLSLLSLSSSSFGFKNLLVLSLSSFSSGESSLGLFNLSLSILRSLLSCGQLSLDLGFLVRDSFQIFLILIDELLCLSGLPLSSCDLKTSLGDLFLLLSRDEVVLGLLLSLCLLVGKGFKLGLLIGCGFFVSELFVVEGLSQGNKLLFLSFFVCNLLLGSLEVPFFTVELPFFISIVLFKGSLTEVLMEFLLLKVELALLFKDCSNTFVEIILLLGNKRCSVGISLLLSFPDSISMLFISLFNSSSDISFALRFSLCNLIKMFFLSFGLFLNKSSICLVACSLSRFLLLLGSLLNLLDKLILSLLDSSILLLLSLLPLFFFLLPPSFLLLSSLFLFFSPLLFFCFFNLALSLFFL